MGIVGFHWAPGSRYKLMLLHNRDNWRSSVINPAAWERRNLIFGGRNRILGGFSEETGGTWFGCSKRGRVAFLVERRSMLGWDTRGVDLEPVAFLKSTETPLSFAQLLQQREEEAYDEDDEEFGTEYHLIVADLNSNSMIYICKEFENSPYVTIQEVPVGANTLSINGLNDDTNPRDLRMQSYLSAIISEYENQELPHPSEVAARFMYERVGGGADSSSLFVERMEIHPLTHNEERYGTTSTTAFTVDSANQATFYERCLGQDGQWREQNINFNINN